MPTFIRLFIMARAFVTEPELEPVRLRVKLQKIGKLVSLESALALPTTRV